MTRAVCSPLPPGIPIFERDPAPQVRAAVQRLTEVERSLNALSAEAASVHQALAHVQLI